MIKLTASFKRADQWLPAKDCGIVTQAGEYSSIFTAAIAAGIALATAPVAVVSCAAVSASLLVAGHHLDHKKLEAQDTTPVVDTSVVA